MPPFRRGKGFHQVRHVYQQSHFGTIPVDAILVKQVAGAAIQAEQLPREEPLTP
jgi:hypothetical protein